MGLHIPRSHIVDGVFDGEVLALHHVIIQDALGAQEVGPRSMAAR